jgi:hypothetical protein
MKELSIYLNQNWCIEIVPQTGTYVFSSIVHGVYPVSGTGQVAVQLRGCLYVDHHVLLLFFRPYLESRRYYGQCFFSKFGL